jgi:hypothetical protein
VSWNYHSCAVTARKNAKPRDVNASLPTVMAALCHPSSIKCENK